MSKTYDLLYEVASRSEVVDTHDHLRTPSDLGTPMTVSNLLLHTYVAKCIRLPDGSTNGIGNRFEDVLPVDYPNFKQIARRAGLSSYFVQGPRHVEAAGCVTRRARVYRTKNLEPRTVPTSVWFRRCD